MINDILNGSEHCCDDAGPQELRDEDQVPATNIPNKNVPSCDLGLGIAGQISKTIRLSHNKSKANHNDIDDQIRCHPSDESEFDLVERIDVTRHQGWGKNDEPKAKSEPQHDAASVNACHEKELDERLKHGENDTPKHEHGETIEFSSGRILGSQNECPCDADMGNASSSCSEANKTSDMVKAGKFEAPFKHEQDKCTTIRSHENPCPTVLLEHVGMPNKGTAQEHALGQSTSATGIHQDAHMGTEESMGNAQHELYTSPSMKSSSKTVGGSMQKSSDVDVDVDTREGMCLNLARQKKGTVVNRSSKPNQGYVEDRVDLLDNARTCSDPSQERSRSLSEMECLNSSESMLGQQRGAVQKRQDDEQSHAITTCSPESVEEMDHGRQDSLTKKNGTREPDMTPTPIHVENCCKATNSCTSGKSILPQLSPNIQKEHELCDPKVSEEPTLVAPLENNENRESRTVSLQGYTTTKKIPQSGFEESPQLEVQKDLQKEQLSRPKTTLATSLFDECSDQHRGDSNHTEVWYFE